MKVKKANKGFYPTKLTLAVAAALAAIGSAPAPVLAAESVPTAAAPASAPTAAAPDNKLEEIMVTARRDRERLQEIPVSVQVVSGETIQKMGMTSVDEIAKLAPGLTLVNAGNQSSVVLRGVTWQPGSGTAATPIYLNEVSFDPQNTMRSMFDMDQIEVLRGPQGTSRGAPSISGAVTMTTKRPNLRAIGGYVEGSLGQANHSDLQGAFNYPIIDNQLAIRVAGNYEDSEGNRITSVNSSAKPKLNDRTLRATLLWEPTDALSFQAMYQQRKTLVQYFDQVAGPGSPGAAAVPGLSPAIPANFNGPALSASNRSAVESQPWYQPENVNLLTINASWEVLGHKLSYNFGDQRDRRAETFQPTGDMQNMLPGFASMDVFALEGTPQYRTNELRLSSLPDPGQRLNYDIGWFQKFSSGTDFFGHPVYMAGAFGNPLTAAPGAVTTPNPRYVLNTSSDIGLGQRFDSIYANARFHVTDRDELSVGLAKVHDKTWSDLNVHTGGASIAVVNPLLSSTAFCPLVAASGGPGATSNVSAYNGPSGVVCDLNLPVGVGNTTDIHNKGNSDLLYNFSLSHKFSDDLLAYFTTGTSFRVGLPAINNTGLPANLTFPKPEKAKSYELGVKSTIGNKLRINADVFLIDYKNQLTSLEGVQYFNTVDNKAKGASIAFYGNVDAQVRGLELDIAANPIRHLSLDANFSYSQIKSQGGSVPCTDATQPALSLANRINFCSSPKGQVLNTQSPFQATFSGGYDVPLDNSLGAYFRFNANYHGNNPNYGNFRTGNGTSFKSTSAYTVVDLFAGISGPKGSWDLGLYAKNAFDKQVELARILTLNGTPTAASPGYDVVRTNLPREAGVKLRYAFGAK